MKKVVIITLALIMAILPMGCSKKNEKKDDKLAELVWYQYGTPTREADLVFEEVSKITSEKINATVTAIPIAPASYSEKMKMILAANEEFDICFTAQNDFITHSLADAFLPVEDLLKSHGKDILEVVPDYYFDSATINGHIMAVPTLKDSAHECVLRYKTMYAEKYNMDFSNVKTLADMEPFLQIIKENEPDVYPMVYRGNSNWNRFLPFEEVNGCAVGAFDIRNYDKIINQFETEEFKEHFRLMRDWYLKGYVRKDAATALSDEDIYKAGNYFAGGAEALPYQELQLNLTRTDDQKEKYIYITEPRTYNRDLTGSMQAISSTSSNPEKAMEFINLLYSDAEIVNLVVNGIPGKHYIDTTENHFKLPNGINTVNENDYYGTVWAQGNRFLQKTIDGTPDDIWDKYKEFNESALKSKALGFVFDGSDLKNEIAAIQNVYQEYLPMLHVGAVDPDEVLPQALEKFRIAGLDKVLEEMNRQYSEWKANK